MKSLLPFIVVGLCAGMYFVYIAPTLSDINLKSEKKAEYENVLGRVKELKQQRDSLSTKYNNVDRSDIEKLNMIIPSKFDTTYFSNDLDSIASKYGMRVKNIKINYDVSSVEGDAEAGDKNYKTITAGFGLSGTYDQFISFLKDLESSLRLMDVVSLSVKSNSKDNGNILDYSVEIQTYALQ